MIQGRSVLGIIPARGGSKGLPRKNVRKLAGKPLIAWTIKAAQASKYLDRIIVSSEDREIIAVSRMCGGEVPFIRPAKLAEDDVSGIEPILHALKKIRKRYDFVVVLQPTSPLRTTDDIDGCIKACVENNHPACVSLVEASPSPYWMFRLGKNDRIIPILRVPLVTRRQDLQVAYALNGSVYVARTDWLQKKKTFINKETAGYIMPRERSVDIDTPADFLLCEMTIKTRNSTHIP